MNRYILSFLFLTLFSVCLLTSATEVQAFSFFSDDSASKESEDHEQSSAQGGGGSSKDANAEEDEEDEDEDFDMTDDPLEDLDDEFMDDGY